MANNTKIRTRSRGDRTEILVMVRHPTQYASKEEGQTSVRFIEEMTYFLNGRVVAVADLGRGIADTPVTSISLTGTTAGDAVAVSWRDSVGDMSGAETIVK